MNQLPSYFQSKEKNETLSLIHAVLAGLLGFTLAIFAYLEYQQGTLFSIELILIAVMMFIFIILNVLACIRVKKGQNQGLILSRVTSVLMLFIFPLGTLLGLFALSKTLKQQWES